MTHIPYSCQSIDESDVDAVVAVLRSEFLTQGPNVPAFEEAFAREHEVDHAVAVCNATAALHIACLALGVGPGKRVWTSPNSFLASAQCALYCGATVDFVDIDPSTRNISLAAFREKLEVAARAGALPHLVIPVDFAGLPCDLREIRELADRFGFRILQDASHAVGGYYLGRPVGSAFADASVFSFHAVKVITTAEGAQQRRKDLHKKAQARKAADLLIGDPKSQHIDGSERCKKIIGNTEHHLRPHSDARVAFELEQGLEQWMSSKQAHYMISRKILALIYLSPTQMVSRATNYILTLDGRQRLWNRVR